MKIAICDGQLCDVVERVEPLTSGVDSDVDVVLPGGDGAALEPAADLALLGDLRERLTGLRGVQVQQGRLVAQREDRQVDPRAAQGLLGVLLEAQHHVEVLSCDRAVEQLPVPLEVEVDEAELSVAVPSPVADAALEIRGDVPHVGVDNLAHLAGGRDPALGQHDRPVAEVHHAGEAVADEDDGASLLRGRLHPPKALLLEGEVAHREDLVDDQDLGLQVGSHREGKPELHPAGVALHRSVDEGSDIRELHDLLEAALDLAALHVEDRPVQEDVLAAGELRMEARAHLEQRSDPAAKACLSLGRQGDLGEDLEEGALAGAVVTDHPQRLPTLHLEVDVPQRPELLRFRTPSHVLDPLADPLRQQLVAGLVPADLVALAEVVDLDCDVVGHAQMTSAKYCSARRK